MVKCSICSTSLVNMFLEKIKGTIIHKPGLGKEYPICFACQKKFLTKEALLKQL